MKLLLVIIMFFVLGALLIISNNNLALNTEGNTGKFFELYIQWIDGFYLNFQKITGEIVKTNWFPK